MTKENENNVIEEHHARIRYFTEHKTIEGFNWPESPDEPIPVPSIVEDASIQLENRIFKMEGGISARELLDTELPETRFVIDNLLPVGLSFLGGRPKIGKSWLALQMALAVGLGGEFLGEQAAQGSVIYLAYEDAVIRLQDRMKAQGITDEIPQVTFFPSQAAHKEFDNLNAYKGEKLRFLTEEFDLVIVDTLSQAMHFDYNDNNEMAKALRPIQEIAQENGAAILFVDHHRKPKMRGINIIDDLMGGTAKAAIADTIWGLYEENKATYLEIASREIQERKMQVRFDIESCTWLVDDSQPQIRLGNLQKFVILALQELGEATIPQIVDYLKTLGINSDRSNVFGSANGLARKGVLSEKDNAYKLV